MTGHGEKLSRNQEKAIAALLSKPSIPEAAKEIGIGERTLWRWIKDEGFNEAYGSARREIINSAIWRIQTGMTKAIDTLEEVMSDKIAPASARVSAAKTVLDIALKAVELEDLQKRVEALEHVVKNIES